MADIYKVLSFDGEPLSTKDIYAILENKGLTNIVSVPIAQIDNLNILKVLKLIEKSQDSELDLEKNKELILDALKALDKQKEEFLQVINDLAKKGLSISTMCQAGRVRSVMTAAYFELRKAIVIDKAGDRFGDSQFGINEIRYDRLGNVFFNEKNGKIYLGDNEESTDILVVLFPTINVSKQTNPDLMVSNREDFDYLMNLISKNQNMLQGKINIVYIPVSELLVKYALGDEDTVKRIENLKRQVSLPLENN